MKDVTSAEHLNYTNAEGDEVWILANNPNFNQVISGSGNDEIIGSVTIDYIQGGDGQDTIDAGAGNDDLSGGGGDDTFIHNVGLDSFTGGIGSDTADYSKLLSDVNADLSTLVEGYYEVIVGDREDGEIDQLITVENIRTGSDTDTLIGDKFDNYLSAGGGADILAGGLGNDILDGGADTDIAD
jgi:Ca2+-binding RTX toxin-like protein